MATFKNMEKLAQKAINESDETIKKIYQDLPLFDAANFILILEKLGRKVYI